MMRWHMITFLVVFALVPLCPLARGEETQPRLVIPANAHLRLCRPNRVSVHHPGGRAIPVVSRECNASTQLSSSDRILNSSRCHRTIKRSWALVDACGNRATGSQLISIDQLADSYAAPPNVTVTSANMLENLTVTGRPKLVQYCGDTSRIQYRDEWMSRNLARRVWTIELHCDPHSIVFEQFLSISDPCQSGPCENGGLCQPLGHDDYRCECQTGSAGARCQEALDPCSPNPCHNQARCESTALGFQCHCEWPFVGRHCEQLESFSCTGKPEGNYACRRCSSEYYSCHVSGQVHKRQCPRGAASKLVFDQDRDRCDYASAVGCDQVYPCPIRITAQWSRLRSNETDVTFTCDGKATGDYACKPCSSNYWTCAVGGHAYRRNCHPDHLVYAEAANMCVWPAQAGCERATACLVKADGV